MFSVQIYSILLLPAIPSRFFSFLIRGTLLAARRRQAFCRYDMSRILIFTSDMSTCNIVASAVADLADETVRTTSMQGVMQHVENEEFSLIIMASTRSLATESRLDRTIGHLHRCGIPVFPYTRPALRAARDASTAMRRRPVHDISDQSPPPAPQGARADNGRQQGRTTMNTAVETYAIVTILLALSIGALLVDRSMRAFRSRRWHCVHEPVALRIVMRTLTSPPAQHRRAHSAHAAPSPLRHASQPEPHDIQHRPPRHVGADRRVRLGAHHRPLVALHDGLPPRREAADAGLDAHRTPHTRAQAQTLVGGLAIHSLLHAHGRHGAHARTGRIPHRDVRHTPLALGDIADHGDAAPRVDPRSTTAVCCALPTAICA